MVGQESVKNAVNEYIENNTLPRFMIVVGVKGSGKKEFCKYISSKLKCHCLVYDNKVEEVRNLINLAYQQTEPILYVIPDYESMAPAAKSALLKVSEEVPQNAYIVLTSENKSDILPTLLSRGAVFELEDYTQQQLNQFADGNKILTQALKFCRTPGDLLKAKELDIEEFNSFVELVWNNLSKAYIGNALKITQKLKLKEESQGYDVDLFLNGLLVKASEYINNTHTKEILNMCASVISIIFKTRNKLSSKFNKQSIMDMCILDLREVMYGVI